MTGRLWTSVNRDDFNEKVEDHVKGSKESKLDSYKPEIDEMFEKEMRSKQC